jgi:hypothetical protein
LILSVHVCDRTPGRQGVTAGETALTDTHHAIHRRKNRRKTRGSHEQASAIAAANGR